MPFLREEFLYESCFAKSPRFLAFLFSTFSCFSLVKSHSMSAEEQPIQTLYINNLNDKLPKEQLKQSLYLLFSQFGTILDVVTLKTEKMRGQAWVSFLAVQSAVDAKNKLQGFDFFGKPMVLVLLCGTL